MQTRPFIIGLGHRSGHGKDLTANYMVEWFQDNVSYLKVKKLSWAWKLKDICHQLYGHLGLREPEFYDTDEGRAVRNIKLPKVDLTPVEIWVKFGTPAVREQVWDRSWIEWVVGQTEYDIIICPDTRFYNEIEMCDIAFKVTNPRIPNREGVSVDDVLQDYNGWFAEMHNTGDKEFLRNQANHWAYTILNRIYNK